MPLDLERPLARRFAMLGVAGVALASIALAAAAPAHLAAKAPPASNGRLLALRLADAPPPRPAVTDASPLDVRPTPVDAPLSPELASVQEDASLRALAAAEARRSAIFDAEQRRQTAQLDADLARADRPLDPGAYSPQADASDSDDED